MKKLLLRLGTLSTVVMPVVVTVSCGAANQKHSSHNGAPTNPATEVPEQTPKKSSEVDNFPLKLINPNTIINTQELKDDLKNIRDSEESLHEKQVALETKEHQEKERETQVALETKERQEKEYETQVDLEKQVYAQMDIEDGQLKEQEIANQQVKDLIAKDFKIITAFEEKEYEKQVNLEKQVYAQMDIEDGQLKEQEIANKQVKDLIDKDFKTIMSFEAKAKDASDLKNAIARYDAIKVKSLSNIDSHTQGFFETNDLDLFEKPDSLTNYYALDSVWDVNEAIKNRNSYNTLIERVNNEIVNSVRSKSPIPSWKNEMNYLSVNKGIISDSKLQEIREAWVNNLKDYGGFKTAGEYLVDFNNGNSRENFDVVTNSEFPIYFENNDSRIWLSGYGMKGPSALSNNKRIEIVNKILEKMPMGRVVNLMREGLFIIGSNVKYSAQMKNNAVQFHYDYKLGLDEQVSNFIEYLKQYEFKKPEISMKAHYYYSIRGHGYNPGSLHFEIKGKSVHHFTAYIEGDKNIESNSVKEVIIPRTKYLPIYKNGKIINFEPYQVFDLKLNDSLGTLGKTLKLRAFDENFKSIDLYSNCQNHKSDLHIATEDSDRKLDGTEGYSKYRENGVEFFVQDIRTD